MVNKCVHYYYGSDHQTNKTHQQDGAGRPSGGRHRISNLPLSGTTTDDVTRGSSAVSVTSSRSAQYQHMKMIKPCIAGYIQ